MQLKQINKAVYRKNLNRLIFALIAILALASLGISQLLIFVFTDREGTHFSLNLVGTAITVTGIVYFLNKYREHPAMHEIVYVWELKQELNRIYRKLKKVKSGIEAGEKDAMTILNFSYHGSKQLYELDDNTITLDDLEKSMRELEQTISEHGYDIAVEDYRPELLKRY